MSHDAAATGPTGPTGSTGSTGDLELENAHFRVTRWTIQPGGHIPMHIHEHEYVVVPLTGGTMHVKNADGSSTNSVLEPGASYSRPSGSEHTIANHSESETIVFIEVERLS